MEEKKQKKIEGIIYNFMVKYLNSQLCNRGLQIKYLLSLKGNKIYFFFKSKLY